MRPSLERPGTAIVGARPTSPNKRDPLLDLNDAAILLQKILACCGFFHRADMHVSWLSPNARARHWHLTCSLADGVECDDLGTAIHERSVLRCV
jgi:hypothetical protein